jgi:putative membrane protein
MAWYDYHEHLRGCYGWHNRWHIGAIVMLVLLVVIIGLVVWGVMTLVKHGRSVSRSVAEVDALDIAKRRYARGEITKEQFDQIKKDLL